jgi:pimeloyl-ACP methyl ester carboxylesterase
VSALPDIPGTEHGYAEIQTADAGAIRVHYAEGGSGDPVVLVHGWPQHFWCWRFVALNTPVPWAPVSPRVALESWRTWYAVTLALAGTRMLARRPGLAHWMLRHGYVHEGITDEHAYAERLREPARSRASQLLYRSYLRSYRDVVMRRYRADRLTVPTRLVFGAKDLYVSAATTRGWEEHADDMSAEYVPDSGHFIPEEKPDLVADRIRAFFA